MCILWNKLISIHRQEYNLVHDIRISQTPGLVIVIHSSVVRTPKGLFLQPCLYTWFDFDLTVDDKVRTVGENMEKENK